MEREANRDKANEKKRSSQKNQIHTNTQRSGAMLAGIDCKTYARNHSLTEEQVWQKVLNGDLQGRTFQGRLYIVDSEPDHALATADSEVEIDLDLNKPLQDPVQMREQNTQRTSLPDIKLPPIPIDIESSNHEHYMEVVERKVSVKSTPTQERSLEVVESSVLLEHMSIMQAEQHELLALTKAAIEKITDQANQLAQAKDEIIALKNAELDRLRSEKEQSDRQLKKARQEIEDLTMLNDTLMAAEGTKEDEAPVLQ